MSERLQKLLAQCGVASRRKAEQLITEGRVKVNGQIVTELGSKASLEHDRISVDGQALSTQTPTYVLLHKPRGVVSSTHDPEGRSTVLSCVEDIPQRLFPVGRLDYHTSGALLLTNDGALSQTLLRPEFHTSKRYHCVCKATLTQHELRRLREGVQLDDGYTTLPAKVEVIRHDGSTTLLRIDLHEGKNRQIHRMLETLGHRVHRLIRISFAGLSIQGLAPGRYRHLKPAEITTLKRIGARNANSR